MINQSIFKQQLKPQESREFQTAINELDKSIDHLQKTNDVLLGTNRNLRLANNKAQDVRPRSLLGAIPLWWLS
jgi:hypothetical protein